MNQAYASMHGYYVEEMIGRRVEDFHDLSINERIVENDVARNQLVTRGSWVGELVHIRKDSTLFPMYHCDILLKKKDGTPTGVVSICRDITQQKLALQAAQESEERYRTLFEKANEAVLIVDPETGRILDANREAE